MIDVIVSDNCPHCDQQKVIMRDAFDREEYRLIQVGSFEFDALDVKELIDVVPFILVRDEGGEIKYANKGNLEAIKIRRIMNSDQNTFNLRNHRRAV